ncbi:MAG: hypothetical protein Q3X12_05740, partial [Hallella sp.]|nr:hypothetical protein [Hallella sp.]
MTATKISNTTNTAQTMQPSKNEKAREMQKTPIAMAIATTSVLACAVLGSAELLESGAWAVSYTHL